MAKKAPTTGNMALQLMVLGTVMPEVYFKADHLAEASYTYGSLGVRESWLLIVHNP